MAGKTTKRDTGRDLDALMKPLHRALGNISATLKSWDESAVRAAISAMEKCSPLDLDNPDLCEAERILREALYRANAGHIARNAPRLEVDIVRVEGHWTLCAGHAGGDALRREFASFAEAKAAGETLYAFLGLQGRADEFSWQPPNSADLARDACADLDNGLGQDIPF